MLPPRLSILIIDDDQDDIDLFREAALALDSNIKIDSATSVEEALNFLNKSSPSPNYIFLDLNMPKMNGKECIAILKKDPRFKSIPLAVYTTSKLPNDLEQSRTRGAEYFITKPTRLSDLTNAISEVINNLPPPKSNSDH